MTHALRVAAGSGAFRELFVAVEGQGARAGWLDLVAAPQAQRGAAGTGGADDAAGLEAIGVAAPIDAALDDGAWKAVAVERRRTVAVKRRRGAAVLRDLLREHFRGCRVVLVRGDIALPVLRPCADGWELEGLEGEVRRLSTADLLRALRAPHLPV